MSRKKKFKRILLCALLISIPLLHILSNTTNNNIDNKAEMCNNIIDTIKVDTLSKVLMYKDSIKNELIGEVEKYVFKNYPKTNKDIPSLITEYGLNHNIDIIFMMAQTQQETGFGTLGAGREVSRRSLFGVAIRKYETYALAINDYINLLKKSYLTKGRTEQHLMQRYVTTNGARYAENPNYENTLRRTYNLISKQTNIKELQNKYTNS